MKLIPAPNGKRKVDILRGSLYRNSSAVVQMKIARERADHDAWNFDRAQDSRYDRGNFCVQRQFTSL